MEKDPLQPPRLSLPAALVALRERTNDLSVRGSLSYPCLTKCSKANLVTVAFLELDCDRTRGREREYTEARVNPGKVRAPEGRLECGWSFPFPCQLDSDQNKAQIAFILSPKIKQLLDTDSEDSLHFVPLTI